MKNILLFRKPSWFLFWSFALLLLMNAQQSWGQISFTSGGLTKTQNFDGLGTSNFSLTDNTSITGIYALRTSGNAVPNIFTADNGGSNSGRFNNYGTTSASDRAMGSASSGTPGTLYYGVRLKNDTGQVITSLSITYTGEQWRNGGNTASQPLTFDYRQAATVTSLTGTFTAVSSLTFNTPTNTATAAALDGNAVANRAVLTATVTVTIPVGEEIMLRWTDINDAGNDHGVAIDDLSITATTAAPCTSQAITAIVPSSITKTFGDAPYSVATTASSNLTVTYASSNTNVATVAANGDVTIQGAGTATITASQAGDGTFCAATPVTQTLTVDKATPTITVSPTASNIIFGQTLASSVLSGGSASVAGTFAFTTPSTQPSGVGTAGYSVTFTPTNTTNFNTVTTLVNVTTDKANSTIEADGFPFLDYNGLPQGPESAIVTGSQGLVTYSYSGTAFGPVSYGPTAVKPTNAGDYSVVATVAEDANYNGATSAAYNFTIAKAGLTVTADDKTAVQNTSIPAFTVSYTGFQNGEDAADLITAPTATSPLADINTVGNYAIVAAGGVSNNYTFTYVDGNFSVTSAAQPICPSGTAIAPIGNQTVCEGSLATLLTATATTSGLNGTPTVQYQWYYNLTESNTVLGATLVDGATSNTYSPSTLASAIETRYYFCVAYATDNDCAQNNSLQALASNVVSVTVIDTPEATVSPAGPITFCAGDSVILTASSGDTYLWSNGATSQSISVSTAGSYSVQVTTNSCQSASSAATSVTVNPLPATPTITPSGATTFCNGGSVTLTSSTGDAYFWSTDEETASIAVTTSGDYSVQVIDGNGCASNPSSVVTVTVSSPLVAGSVTNIVTGTPGPNVVISQIYGGGGNTGATYKNDFIELFNPTTNTISLNGWAIQHASASGGTWSVTALNGSIAPGAYYLIQQAAGTGGTLNLPTPDATGTVSMGATSGKVALTNTTAALSGTISGGTGSTIVDFVGFNSTTFSGIAAAPAPSNTNSISKTNVCVDANSNSTEYTSGTPTPKNSATPIAPCATSTPAQTICSGTAPSAISVTPASGSNAPYTYQWYRFDGLTTAPTGSAIPLGWTLVGSGTTFNPTALTSNATFACFVTPTGCDGSWSNSQRQVTVNALPTATAESVTGCAESAITLVGSGLPSGGTGIYSIANPYTGPSTTYTYTYTAPNGCSTTSAPASVTITPLTTPTVSLSSSDLDNTFAYGTSVTFTATAGNFAGGTASYDFKINGTSVQNGASNSYVVDNLANGNQVSVSITVTGGTCLSASTVDSNVITNTVTGVYLSNITNYCGQTLPVIGSRIKCSVPVGVVGVLGYRFKITNNV
ncbi:beta strand repeat-containing protein, partial [Flavobacterium buctense]